MNIQTNLAEQKKKNDAWLSLDQQLSNIHAGQKYI